MDREEQNSLSEQSTNHSQEDEELLRSHKSSSPSKRNDANESLSVSLSAKAINLRATNATSSVKESDEEPREKEPKEKGRKGMPRAQTFLVKEAKHLRRPSEGGLNKEEGSRDDIVSLSTIDAISTQQSILGDKESFPSQTNESFEDETTEHLGTQNQTNDQPDCLFFSSVYSSSSQSKKHVLLMVLFPFSLFFLTSTLF